MRSARLYTESKLTKLDNSGIFELREFAEKGSVDMSRASENKTSF